MSSLEIMNLKIPKSKEGPSQFSFLFFLRLAPELTAVANLFFFLLFLPKSPQ